MDINERPSTRRSLIFYNKADANLVDMKLPKKIIKIIAPIFLCISLAFVYLRTIAPSLTWANGGADGGDLITAAVTGSIAHPSGYPLFLLLARLFQLLPVGTLAFRTNLMSAFFAVLTALLVYAIVYRYLLKELDEYIVTIAALSSGYAIGFAPLFWSQAVITEVYTLNAFLIVLIVYMTASLMENKQSLDRWRGILYGLAMANHLTVIFFIPIALLINSFSRIPSAEEIKIKEFDINWSSLGRQLRWTIGALLIYVILPLRAMTNPVINWGRPSNLENFWWLVSGKIYRAYYLEVTLVSLWMRVEASASLLLHQFGILGITLGFIGAIFFYRRSKLYTLTIWMAVISWGVAIIYQTSDSYIYFIPVLISFSIWMGISIGYSLKSLQKYKSFLQPIFLSVLIVSLTLSTIKHWREVDASQDNRAENFVKEVFELAPENAIVFAEGDNVIFALWYFHFALEERTDLIVLATDLLHYDWYQESMREVYPALILQGDFPWASTVVDANSTRDICYIQYDYQAKISCESFH